MLKRYTCIICPIGCDITAAIDNSTSIAIEGNRCSRGSDYVKQEMTHPLRTIASSVTVRNGELPIASVRLDKAIPKASITEVMKEIDRVVLTAPVRMGQVARKNIAGTESDLIVTKNVECG